jgi:hypothetical protein
MPPVMASPRLVTAPLATGPRLRYAEQGEPQGEALVCLHGYTGSEEHRNRNWR